MIDANLLQKVGAGRTATIYRCGQNQVVKLYRPNFPKKAIDEEFQIGRTVFDKLYQIRSALSKNFKAKTCSGLP
jgi:hypothetical protein